MSSLHRNYLIFQIKADYLLIFCIYIWYKLKIHNINVKLDPEKKKEKGVI